MSAELFLAAFIIAVGLSFAAMSTHLYQGLAKQPATLRYDGPTYLAAMGHLVVSFLCGPYIMLQLGWRREADGAVAVAPVLLSALVAFGWAFITGLLIVGVYVSVLP